jgi:intracellular sulfur oxidation DsrE/DsrF family protein
MSCNSIASSLDDEQTHARKQRYHVLQHITLALLVSLLCFSTPARAETPDDQKALAGLSDVKVAFDLTSGDGKQLLTQLNVIDETRQSLISQGVTPHFVLAFRGPATKLVQTDPSQVKAEDREYTAKIAQKVKELQAAKGVESMEQCSVAIRLAGTKPENVLPGVTVVGNGWISLMSYQSKGYGYIAP